MVISLRQRFEVISTKFESRWWVVKINSLHSLKTESTPWSLIYFHLAQQSKRHRFVIKGAWSVTQHDRFLTEILLCVEKENISWGREHDISACCSFSSKILNILVSQTDVTLTSLSLGEGEPSWWNGGVWLLRRSPLPICWNTYNI